MKRIRGVALVMFLALLLLCAVAIINISTKSFTDEIKTVVFNSSGQKIYGSYVQGDLNLDKGAILLHEEGKDKTSMTALASALNREGYTVFYYDLPGHGETDSVFSTDLYTDGYLETTLSKAVDKLIRISGLETEDIILVGEGLGARCMLKYVSQYNTGQDLYLIQPLTARSDTDLITDELVAVSQNSQILILYSGFNKDYCTSFAPTLYRGLTNEELKIDQSRNINLSGTVEFDKLDYAIPGLEQSSNAYIKKIVFKVAANNNKEISDDYFNTRSILFFLIIFSMVAMVYFLGKAFVPSVRINRKEKSPYGFGLKRLLLSAVVIGLYLLFKLYYADRLVYNISPFYDMVLVIFAGYMVTGLHELKFRKVIHTGDTALGGGVAFFVGFLFSVGILFWSLAGFNGLHVFKTKWFYLSISIIISWMAFYFYTLEFTVMYMKGASARGQRYLIRLAFLVPFIMLLILAWMNGGTDLYRMGLQFGLIWFCLYYAEGLQRLGNNLPVSAFFPAVLYSFLSVSFSVMI
ncbi:MAG: hypothetical protein AB1Z19_03560 [Eubacteriales bacterium]